MQELLESDTVWSFLLNLIGLVSLIVGGWLIFKLLLFIIKLKKNNNINAKNYINLLKLPSTFKGLTQIGILSNIQQEIEFKILDSSEKILDIIFKEKVDIGEKIIVMDTNKYENGNYYILISTSYQSILRKILIDN